MLILVKLALICAVILGGLYALHLALALAARKLAPYGGVRGFFAHLADTADRIVLEVEQTFVADLRAAAPDGKLDAKVASEALQKAVDKFKAAIGPAAMQILAGLLGGGDVGEFITGLIESAVGKLKIVQPPAFAPLAASSPAK